ncbi:CLK4-associating serine/arginine rich protein-like [Zingiber officinale]|uniref:CLK4-associating serine/arginine rich protein-like n=1 Tax=Zingiber officinale TaxID=94328 RepID=UPI001C4B999A|nr:CLK4-associating serine/arginine rich protein-like [Zingiber officinale]
MWHEARRSERKVHDLMDAARKRAQRRAVYLAKRRGDPQQLLQVAGTRCRVHRDDGLYQAAHDQQGLIPWNGKQDILIDRFDGRALLDFIRDHSSRNSRVQHKTEEEEEVEEFVNFERYRDLIKLRHRGFSDEDGLQHVQQELEAKHTLPFPFERPQVAQPSVSKGLYSQVGFSYKGDAHDESQNVDSENEDEDDEDEEEEKDFSSDDSNDERMETIAKEFGIKRYNWLVYMDKKAKEEEKRQKEIIKGDPAIRKLSRKERRKASQMEREKERETARMIGWAPHHDPYRESRRSPTYDAYPRSKRSRSRSRSRSYSPSQSRRHDRSSHGDNGHRSKSKPPKIEYITEFGGLHDLDDQKFGVSPPSSPLQADPMNRPSGGRILEALHVDPASSLSLEQEKSAKMLRPSMTISSKSSSAIAKLSKTPIEGSSKTQQGEKKETPQERLKRIMSKQLNKQIRKDNAAEMAKRRELEKQRQEKLAEASRISRYSRHSRSRSRSCSSSPPRRRRYSRSHSRSRSPRRYYSRSGSHSRSPSPRSRSRTRY